MSSTGVRLIWPMRGISIQHLPLIVYGTVSQGNPGNLQAILRQSDGRGEVHKGKPINTHNNSLWAFLFAGFEQDLPQAYELCVSHSQGVGQRAFPIIKQQNLRLFKAEDYKNKPLYGGGITIHWPTNGVSAYTHSGLICYGTCPTDKPVTSATLEYVSSQTVYLGTIMDAGMPDFWLAYFSTPESGIHSVRLEAFNDDGSEVSTFTLY